MKHVPFSSTTFLTFTKAKIRAGPLTVISNNVPELKSLGLKEGVGSNRLTFNQTRDLISLILAHVSFSVSMHILISPFMPTIAVRQAGCRILVNAILLHVVSNLSGAEVNIGIVPEFTMESTRFEYASTSYGGIVDFLIFKGSLDPISKYEIQL